MFTNFYYFKEIDQFNQKYPFLVLSVNAISDDFEEL